MPSQKTSLFLALALVPGALAAGVTIPHVFSNNTVADATQVNANFTALATAIDARHGTGATKPATGARGDFFMQDDGRLYVHDGVRWRFVQLGSEPPALPAGLVAADVLNHFAFDGVATDTGANVSGSSVAGAISYLNGAFDRAATGFSTTNGVATTRLALTSFTTSGFTLSAWVKGADTTATSGDYHVANNVFGDTNSNVWMGAGIASGRAAVKGQSTERLSTASVATDTWRHIAFVFTYSGGTWTVQIYVDGIADGGGTLPTGGNPNYGINAIGRTWPSYVQTHGYAIDEAYIFGKALSAAQIAALAGK